MTNALSRDAKQLSETLSVFVLRQEDASLTELDQQLVSNSANVASQQPAKELRRWDVKSETKSLRNLTNVIKSANDARFLTELPESDLVSFLNTVCTMIENANMKCGSNHLHDGDDKLGDKSAAESGSFADVEVASEESDAFSGLARWDVFCCGTEACLLVMTLLTCDRIPTKVVQEEAIELVLNFLKTQLERMVYPLCDKREQTLKSYQKSSQRKKKAKRDQSCDDEYQVSVKDKVIHSLKEMAILRKTLPALSEALECFALLIRQRSVVDEVLLQLSSLCIKAFEVEASAAKSSTLLCPTQHACIKILRNMFSKVKRHRLVILQDVLTMLRQTSSSTRYCTKLQLTGIGKEIRMSHALVLYLVQACSDPPEVDGVDELMNDQEKHGDKEVSKQRMPSVGSEWRISAYFVEAFCKSCIETTHDAFKEYCAALSSLVDDLLAVLHMPEWPAAEILLHAICRTIARNSSITSSKSKSINTTFGNQGLQILGKVLAVIAKDVKYIRDCPIRIPKDGVPTAKDNDMVNPLEHGEDISCPCGRGFIENETLLSCDCCNRWYHPSCVQVEDENKLEYFQCNDCKVILQVSEQIRMEAVAPGVETMPSVNSYSDSTIFRQLILNYLACHQKNYSDGMVDAMKVYLSMWYKLDLRQGTDSKQRLLVLKQWQDCHTLDGNKISQQSEQSLSTIRSIRVSRQLSSLRPGALCSSNTCILLLSRLLQVLGAGQSSFRSRAIKALADVIEADPGLMRNEKVKCAVEQRIMDDSISVREATLELVGRFARVSVEIAEQYCDVLLERLTDKGLSVRKRVVKILHEILLDHPGLRQRTTVCKGLVSRMVDPTEEDVVKDSAQKTLQELWFSDEPHRVIQATSDTSNVTSSAPASPISSTFTPSSSADTTPQKTPATGSVIAPLTAALAKQRNVPKHKQGKSALRLAKSNATTKPDDVKLGTISKEMYERFYRTQAFSLLDLVATVEEVDWLINMIGTMLRGTNFHSVSAAENAVSSLRDASSQRIALEKEEEEFAEDNSYAMLKNSRSVCEKLVAALVEHLIQLEEGTAPLFHTIGETPLSPIMQLICVLKTLNLFAIAWPRLLVNHIQILTPYLREEDGTSKEDRLLILQSVTSTLNRVVPLVESTDSKFWITVMEDLQHLVFTQPPVVMFQAIECMGMLAQRQDSLLERAEGTLNRFYVFLLKFKSLETLEGQKRNVISSIQRSLFACGALCMTCAFVLPSADVRTSLVREDGSKTRGGFTCENLVSPKDHRSINEQVYIQLVRFWQLNRPFDELTRRKALQGLGFLFRGDSKLMKFSTSRTLLVNAMSSTSPETRSLVLVILCELLESEEARVEIGLAKEELERSTTKEDRVLGDQDILGGAAGMLLQGNIELVLRLLFDMNPKVRTVCVGLVGALLRQGLVNPLQCVERLVALVSDGCEEVRETAQDQLSTIHAKHPEFLPTRVFQGVVKSHSFQLEVFEEATPIIVESRTNGNGDGTFSVYSQLYKKCIRTNRKHRSAFLRSIITAFDTSAAARREAYSVPLLNYLASVIGTLPFSSMDEPLDVIFGINRIVSLRSTVVFESIAEICHGDKRTEIIWAEDVAPGDAKEPGSDTSPGGGSLKDDTTPMEGVDIENGFDDASRNVEHEATSDPLNSEHLETLQALYHQAAALCMLIRVKRYLKEVYQLSDVKCLDYNPSDSVKNLEKPFSRVVQRLPKFEPLKPTENLNVQDFGSDWKTVCSSMGRTLYHLSLDTSDDISTAVPKLGKQKSKRRRSRTQGDAAGEDEPVAKEPRVLQDLE